MPGFRDHRSSSVVLALATALCGCQEPPPRLDDDGVNALQFQDLPVPEGMELLEQFHRSDSREIGDYRYGNFVYGGMLPIVEIREYLLERMPQHAWALEANQTDETGDEHLRFRRGRYVVDCDLKKLPDATTRMELALRTRLNNE